VGAERAAAGAPADLDGDVRAVDGRQARSLDAPGANAQVMNFNGQAVHLITKSAREAKRLVAAA
jgi:hypothetical protein